MINPQQKNLKVILIGDACIDEYQYGTITRLSPEAPVPVFVPNKNDIKYGMAANVAENLKKLNVETITYFGEQSRKIRMIDEKSNQHVIRVDHDIISKPLSINEIAIADFIDAIVVSDYDKGLVTYELVEDLIQTNIPVFIDTKKPDLKRFEGAYVKINYSEFTKAKSYVDKLIVTLGRDGAQFNNKKFKAPNVDITDVCGAGDTFLASFVYQYLSTNNVEEAIKFAIKASTITVKHIGVYAPTLEEIKCLK